MLKRLRVHGFRTLVDTTVNFEPLTIMLGKNGAGKTTILDVLQIIGKFARGGPDRAFGPAPWSLSWQRTKGFGYIKSVDFELDLLDPIDSREYRYLLRLDENRGQLVVEEERLTDLGTGKPIASLTKKGTKSGTILNPDGAPAPEVARVASLLSAFESYELNPSVIERGNDPKHDYVSRDGYGVAGFLANLKDNNPDKFEQLESQFRGFRPETEAIKINSNGADLFWSLADKEIEGFDLPSVHISWGDRQLLGMLCVLYDTKPGATIALEEIDRGFHSSRYEQVISLLTEAAYKGLEGPNSLFQVVATTHSPSFVNKISDRLSEIRLINRAPSGNTRVSSFAEALKVATGTDELDQPAGEVWEMGILEEVMEQQ